MKLYRGAGCPASHGLAIAAGGRGVRRIWLNYLPLRRCSARSVRQVPISRLRRPLGVLTVTLGIVARLACCAGPCAI